jgi:hypothetical protein
MKIIKQGLTGDELNRKLKQTKRFECRTCGCVFEADEGEYESESDFICTLYYCDCPNCKERVFL